MGNPYTHTLAQVLRDLRQRRCFRHIQFPLYTILSVTEDERRVLDEWGVLKTEEKARPFGGWYKPRFGYSNNPDIPTQYRWHAALKFWSEPDYYWGLGYRPAGEGLGLYDPEEVFDRIAEDHGIICDACGKWDYGYRFGRPVGALYGDDTTADLCLRCWSAYTAWYGQRTARLHAKGVDTDALGFEAWLCMRLRNEADKARKRERAELLLQCGVVGR